MKQLLWLLQATLIFTSPLLGMKRQHYTSQQLVPQTSTTSDTPSMLSISHNLSGLSVTHYEFNKNEEKKTKQWYTISPCTTINPFALLFDTASNTVINQLKLVLPTSPQHIYLTIGSDSINYGNSIDIKNGLKTVSIHNTNTKKCLLILPKKNSSLKIGSKKEGHQTGKTMSITNINIPCIRIEKFAYEKSLNSADTNSIEESNILCHTTQSIEEGCSHNFTMPSSSDYPLVIHTAIVISINNALQKIKIYPNDDKIEPNDQLFIQQLNNMIMLFNSDNRLLYYLYTAASAINI